MTGIAREMAAARKLPMLALLALCAATSTAPASPVLRFPIEGGGSAVVCGVVDASSPAGTANASARSDSAPRSPLGAELLRAQAREVSSTLNIPARSWYGPGKWMNDTSLGPWKGGQAQVVELPRPRRVNASCVEVFGGSVDAAGPGMVYVSADNGTTWGNGSKAEWFESVAVAFGLRPYISHQEEDASLLVWSDAAAPPIAEVAMELPFCSPARTQKWKAVAHPRKYNTRCPPQLDLLGPFAGKALAGSLRDRLMLQARY